MIMAAWRRVFSPAPHIPRLPDAEVQRQYPRYRWRIMESTFIGYAMFYLVRSNLSPVAKEMQAALHYDKDMIGTILAATALSYGLGKFLLGALSDRSNPRVFMAVGLLLTAICNFAFGSVASYRVHLLLWTINGFFQGMGWPPCGRSMGHWFSERERGLTFSIWNTSHNVGGGIAGFVAAWTAKHSGGIANDVAAWASGHGWNAVADAANWMATHWVGWQSAFFFPGILATVGAVYLLCRLRDTPQSVGLPPIEEYKNDFTEAQRLHGLQERELSFKELLIDYTLTNKYVWLLAFANFFAYIARYCMLDWGPTYFREVKDATLVMGGIVVLVTEFGGIPSTILFGWFSDLLGGRRGVVSVLCMLPILVAFVVIWLTPAGHFGLDLTMLAIVGFFIYPVINLIVIQALDLTSKKAIGTAAGFIGLVGYLGKAAQAKGFGWMLKHLEPKYGSSTSWSIVIATILLCTVLGVVLLAFTWRIKPKA
jgi:MFS transporter, OPA family, glycerol-3-phosphate transporter